MKAVHLSNSDLAKLHKRKTGKPDLEGELWRQLQVAGVAHLFERQYRFAPRRMTWDYLKSPDPMGRRRWRFVQVEKLRLWRFDFAAIVSHPEGNGTLKLAIEVEGGSFMPAGGGHNRGPGFCKDALRRNEAVLDGWSILTADTNMVRSGVALDFVLRALGRPAAKPKDRLF